MKMSRMAVLTLIAVALLVAIFGLYNALGALQLRRQPENRLLHSLGVERRTFAVIGVQQSLLVGCAAVVLAIPLGLAIAYVLCEAVNPRAFGWSIGFRPSWQNVAMPALGALLAAVAAGLVPAFRSLPPVTGSARNALR